MAFRLPMSAPQRQIQQRPQENLRPVLETSTIEQRPITESQEWVLFPVRSHSSAQTQTVSTVLTPNTAGLSRLSEFGSQGTAERSSQAVCKDGKGEDPAVDEDEELDSLDEGLQAFQEPLWSQEGFRYEQSDSIFPRHDGLGIFPSSSLPIQEQLWHFEQHNPRKRAVGGHHRRRSSLQRRLDAVEYNDEAMVERERNDRIEQWRLEQSKVLSYDMEQEARRSMIRASQQGPQIATPLEQGTERDLDVDKSAALSQEEELYVPRTSALIAREPLWRRITTSIIRDFIGIDEVILAILTGESLPSETVRPSIRLSSTSAPGLSLAVQHDNKWEKRLLDRISRELGILVHELSDYPGTITSPLIPKTLDYAGIPISSSPTVSAIKSTLLNHELPATPHFTPTLQEHPAIASAAASDSQHAALWGIEEEEDNSNTRDPHPQSDLDYWQSPPTLSNLFRYLHSRFFPSRQQSKASSSRRNVATATTNHANSLRRAAIVRQHHPLVSRAYQQRRRSLLASSQRTFSQGEKRRGDSSCASSAKRRRSAASSRNYWDLGGSAVGSADSGGGFGVNV